MAAAETVDVVDESDAVVGSSELRECLRTGTLHRGVAVVVVRSDGRIVLQRRSVRDAWHPGLWTLSSTGHVRRGETYESAALRELYEELGLSTNVEPIGRYRLPTFTDGIHTEKEWVFLFRARTDDACSIDRAELESVDEFDGVEAQRMVDEGPLTPDARILLKEYLDRSKA